MNPQVGLVDHGQVVLQRPILESGDPLFFYKLPPDAPTIPNL